MLYGVSCACLILVFAYVIDLLVFVIVSFGLVCDCWFCGFDMLGVVKLVGFSSIVLWLRLVCLCCDVAGCYLILYYLVYVLLCVWVLVLDLWCCLIVCCFCLVCCLIVCYLSASYLWFLVICCVLVWVVLCLFLIFVLIVLI